MYPYLAGELHIKQERQRLARRAEQHRLTHAVQPRRTPVSSRRRARTSWLHRWVERWVEPALSAVR
jgi:hypothetical protein